MSGQITSSSGSAGGDRMPIGSPSFPRYPAPAMNEQQLFSGTNETANLPPLSSPTLPRQQIHPPASVPAVRSSGFPSDSYVAAAVRPKPSLAQRGTPGARPPCPIANFGFGGRLVVMIPHMPQRAGDGEGVASDNAYSLPNASVEDQYR